jgi:hypothetical protein
MYRSELLTMGSADLIATTSPSLPVLLTLLGTTVATRTAYAASVVARASWR